MGVYPSVALSAATEPLDDEPTPAEIMYGCTHYGACRMQWERHNGAFEWDGYDCMDRLSRLLGCDVCTEWER